MNPIPSESYSGLLRQFKSLVNLVNNQQEYITALTKINLELTTQIGLASLDELESQRKANQQLTNELENRSK